MKHFNNTSADTEFFERTAICFSGELRTFKVAMPRILAYFRDTPADIYCHTWTTSGDHLHKKQDFDLLEEMIDNSVHNFVDMEYQTSINHAGPFGNMLYSIQKANFNKCKVEVRNNFRYDKVIKCRYDMLVPSGKTFGDRQVEDRSIYYSIGNRGLVPNDFGKHGLSDIIFWGDSPSMDIACDTYRYYNWETFPLALKLQGGYTIDPGDSMLSPGTLIYQQALKRNIKMVQIVPQLMETLWRTSVEDLDPDTQLNEIRAAY